MYALLFVMVAALPPQAPMPLQAPPIVADNSQSAHQHHVYEWRYVNPDGGGYESPQIALFEDGKQVGNYSFELRQYHRYLGGNTWERTASKPPHPVPEAPKYDPPSQQYQTPPQWVPFSKPTTLYLQPFVQAPQFFPQGGAYCPPGASS